MKRSRLRARPKKSEHNAELSALWIKAVCGPKARCTVCGTTERLQGHHALSQSVLRAFARTMRITGIELQLLLWDTRNGVPVCEACHAQHTNAVKRIPIYLLPRCVFSFAAELDARTDAHAMSARLRREYPDEVPADA